MSGPVSPTITVRRELSATEEQAVRELIGICNAHEGLDLKLLVNPKDTSTDQGQFVVVAEQNGTIIGFGCSWGRTEAELCGMVHPDHRRQGLGRGLLMAIKDEYQRQQTEQAVLVCESLSDSGQAFVAALGLQQVAAEHRMELVKRPAVPTSLDLQVDQVRDEDLLVSLFAPIFEIPEETARHWVKSDLLDKRQQFFVARLDGEPTAMMRVIDDRPRASVYAFGVLPSFRRRGIARQFLLTVCEQLFEQGFSQVGLEVETENTPAVQLYLRSGMEITTTYQYFAVKFDE